MNPSEQASMFCLFSAAIKHLCPHLTRIRVDNNLFSEVVMELRKVGHILSNKIDVLTGIAGYRSHDFERGLSYAQSMGAVSLLTPEYTHMIINLPARQIKQYTVRSDFDQILPLAKAYLKELGEHV